jgi:hypothetical protein
VQDGNQLAEALGRQRGEAAHVERRAIGRVVRAMDVPLE